MNIQEAAQHANGLYHIAATHNINEATKATLNGAADFLSNQSQHQDELIIGFAEWMKGELFQTWVDNKDWKAYWIKMTAPNTKYTTQQLLEIFKKENGL